MWSLHTPPNVLNFLWRACSDILPTRVNLLRRKIQIDPQCSLCGQSDTIFCGNVHLLTMSGRWLVGKSSYEAFSFYLLARAMVERLDVKELENWAMIAWSLWNARNRFHFERVQTHPTVILRVATSLLEEYQRLALAGRALVSPSFVIIFFFFLF